MPLPLTAWLLRRHGVAHSGTARDAGFSPRSITLAIGSGEVERVRRSWLVARGAGDAHRAAARVGARVTCLSAARSMGLWTPTHDEHHVLVPRTDSRIDRSGLRVHTAQGPVPLPRRVTDEPVVNVLFQVARCATPADALAVWDSALRNRVVDAALLTRVHWRSARAQRLAAVATELSDSGIETRFAVLMRSTGVSISQQVWLDGHPVDALIGERLIVQLDGFAHHSSAESRRRDIRQDARLAVRGFTVLRFDYFQVMFDPDHVVEQVLNALSQGLHLATGR
ncbi:MAG: DUF559 domain-containing protein [Microbacterium sp.]